MDYSYEIENNPILVVGLSGGHVVIYELNSFNALKSITNVQTSKITDIKILSSDPLAFVSADSYGEFYFLTLEKKFFRYEKTSIMLKKFNNNFAIGLATLKHDMRVLNSKSLEEEDFLRRIIAIATLDNVIIASVSQSGDFEIKWSYSKPDTITDDSLPAISWGNGIIVNNQKKTYLAIGWGTYIYLLEFKCDYYKVACTMAAYLNFKLKIEYVGFIAESMIMVLD